MRAIRGTILVSLALFGCQSQKPAPAAADPTLDQLLTKINERLALMEAVARSKYRKGLPAGDYHREQAMLQALDAKALDAALEPKFIRWFFAFQIEAAKRVQENHFRRWKSEGVSGANEVEDIGKLRERIDLLNDELIVALVEFRKHRANRNQIEERARVLIQGEGIDDAVRANAIRPLLELE